MFVLCLANDAYFKENEKNMQDFGKLFFGTHFLIQSTTAESESSIKKDSVIKIKNFELDFFVSPIKSSAITGH
jgi:hypothetical protein